MQYEVDLTVPAGNGWAGVVQKGQRFRISNLDGKQAVETHFYSADNHAERCPQAGAVAAVQSGELGPGARLSTDTGMPLMQVASDGATFVQRHYLELVAENDTLVVISNCPTWTHACRTRNGEDGQAQEFQPVRLLLWNP
ncbi:hypothetical protein F183_A18570 [Bryobacterales bacterium F-183]|nr:hypothetical protein F183_A18570 [Bryobacterales bacterium F-183]